MEPRDQELLETAQRLYPTPAEFLAALAVLMGRSLKVDASDTSREASYAAVARVIRLAAGLPDISRKVR